MSLSMKFPGAYFQGKDALEEFAEHTICLLYTSDAADEL